MKTTIANSKIKMKNTSLLEEENNMIAQEQLEQKYQIPTLSKQELITQKKQQKFDDDIDRCYGYIAANNTHEAIQILKELIIENKYLEKNEFIGIGNRQNWFGFYEKGPIEWFINPKIQGQARKNPFDLLSVCFMLQLHEKTKSIDQIILFYDGLISCLSERLEILTGIGNAYYNNYQYLKAERYYQEALKINEKQKLYEYMAWIKGYQFEVDNVAFEYCQKCLQINPQNIYAAYNKALCVENKQEKKKMLNNILEKHPSYYRAYISMGFGESLAQKLTWYDKALQYDPNYADALAKKGNALKKANNTQARKCFQTALSINPNNVLSYWMLGDLQNSLDNTIQAITCFKKCLQINPYEFEAYLSLGHIYRSNFNNEACIQCFQKYIELNPYNPDGFNFLGLVYDQTDKHDEAIEAYKKALEINPNFIQSLSNLGISYQLKKQFQQAFNCFHKAHQIQPNNGSYCYGMAICLAELQKYSASEQWALLSLQKGGDEQNEIHQFLGDLYKNMGHYDQSMESYLAHSNTNRQLNTQYIIENLVKQVERSEIVSILSNILEKQTNNKNNLYKILQISKLLIFVDEYELAEKAFSIVKEITAEGYVPIIVRKQLRKFYGDQKHGIGNYITKGKLNNLKKNFFTLFQQFYGHTNQ